MKIKSQSPLIGAFVPGLIIGEDHERDEYESQSPLIGAFVPGIAELAMIF